MTPTRLLEILRALGAHRVEYVIVGGAAGALLGAAFTTQDLDVVYERTEENIGRLLDALAELDAIYAHDLARRRLAPTASHLALAGPKLLETKYGRLDLLGQINESISWSELVADAVTLDVGEGVQARVVSLARLIAIKEWLVSLNLSDRGPKDQLQLLQLKALASRSKDKG